MTIQGGGPFHLRVKAGECVGITGASGSGKSLFLRAVADLDPRDGRVSLDGVAAETVPGHQWRRRVGLLPAESRWWAGRVGDHFKTADERWLAEMGFEPETMEWSVSRLSSGERQRLGLLRLLAVRPKALLLDEPTANLDGENVRRAERVVAEYRRMFAPPVLWVGHDPEQVRRVADRHLRLTREGFREIGSTVSTGPTGSAGAVPSGKGAE
jgi:ABC-type iron transport system FetAB ATPase subunit